MYTTCLEAFLGVIYLLYCALTAWNNVANIGKLGVNIIDEKTLLFALVIINYITDFNFRSQ